MTCPLPEALKERFPQLFARLDRLVRFGISGVLAVSTDILATTALTQMFGVNPLIARIAAICLATVVGWLAHRTITFSIRSRPSWQEFARYVSVAWLSITTNYTVFALVLAIGVRSNAIAIIISSLVAMFVAFFGMKLLVFRPILAPRHQSGRDQEFTDPE